MVKFKISSSCRAFATDGFDWKQPGTAAAATASTAWGVALATSSTLGWLPSVRLGKCKCDNGLHFLAIAKAKFQE